MKIKILEVSECSAHYGAPYSLVGTIGEVDKISTHDGYGTFVRLKNCQHVNPSEEYGHVNGDWTSVFISAYEVVEK